MNLKVFHNSVKSVNNSKLFAGIIMLLMNIGSRYIQVKFSKSQEAFMKNYVVREVLIFAVCWMATRDIVLSIILTASFFVLTEHLFNEDSQFCVLPEKYRQLHMAIDTNNDGEISQKEIAEAVDILKKAKMQKKDQEKERLYTYFSKNRI
jgi:uncharacterized protein YdcH (DUF465 family)